MQQRQKEDDARRQKFLKEQNLKDKKEAQKQKRQQRKKKQPKKSEITQSGDEAEPIKEDWKPDKLMKDKKIYGDSDSEGSFHNEDQIPKRRLRSSA